MIFVMGKIDKMNTAFILAMKQSPMHIMYSHSLKTSQFKINVCLNHDFCDW
jgi:hypothetical protein